MRNLTKNILFSFLSISCLICIISCGKVEQKSSATKSVNLLDNLKVTQDGKPANVLLITVDTLRLDYLHCNGYPLNTSPNIDKLVQSSIYFEHAVTPMPRTTPSLSCLLTGLYPQYTKVRTLWDHLPDERVTLAEILQKANYQTVAVVSNHIITPERKLYQGFQIYDAGTDERDAIVTTKSALRHLNKLSDDKPFFFWVHYIDPHVPYYPPEKYVKEFDPNYRGRYQWHFGSRPGAVANAAYPDDIGKDTAVFHNPLSAVENEHIRRLYAGDVRLTDDGIGELLEGFRKRAGENLLIIFTADHGESLGEHDYFYDHGEYVYNPEVRVPLSIHLPGDANQKLVKKISDWVSLIDITPTLLDLLNIKMVSAHPPTFDGISLTPEWKGTTLPPRKFFVECGESYFRQSVHRRVRFNLKGRFRGIEYNNTKLIWTPYLPEENAYELYDLTKDPMERNNLYSQNTVKATELKMWLHQWVQEDKGEEGKSGPSKEDLEKLKSLGYVQ